MNRKDSHVSEKKGRSGSSPLHQYGRYARFDSYLGASSAGIGQHRDEFCLSSGKLNSLVVSQTAQQSINIH